VTIYISYLSTVTYLGRNDSVFQYLIEFNIHILNFQLENLVIIITCYLSTVMQIVKIAEDLKMDYGQVVIKNTYQDMSK
jgi:hypothetical protein